MIDDDIDAAISALDLSEFGTTEEIIRLRNLIMEFREVFIPTTKVATASQTSGPAFEIRLN